MLPSGFLGTRADILMDFALIAVVLSPLIMLCSFRLAKRREYKKHGILQTGLLVLILITVVLFEIDIRLSGGSAAFIRLSRFAQAPFLHYFLKIHIALALTSFSGWFFLVLLSWKKFLRVLPGEFSVNHVFWGRWIYRGVVSTAVSGAGLYIFVFVV